ncbi:MAG TPA: pantoate--beta-alanine ligase [Candidatus Xenobia bacterium]|jgi:pantoate--beta-alanine ligase
MNVLRTPVEMQQWSRLERDAGSSIGFVPTMGYLHPGHMALVKQAHTSADVVVVSIFVNPKQFGPREDLAAYPRDLDGDLHLLESAGVEALFLPDHADMYPEGFNTSIHVAGLTEGLCGASRPGHFDGVATVVLKLFNIVLPHVAVFGQKDYQQLRVIEQMVEDLNLEVRIASHPIVREQDGLALSSRNAYLTESERSQAAIIPIAVGKARDMVAAGKRDARVVVEALRAMFHREAPQLRIDYIDMVSPATLKPVHEMRGRVLLALAVHVGKARLIDNALIDVP